MQIQPMDNIEDNNLNAMLDEILESDDSEYASDTDMEWANHDSVINHDSEYASDTDMEWANHDSVIASNYKQYSHLKW